LQGFAFGEGVADMQLSVVVDADDVARHSIFHAGALVGHEDDGVGDLHVLAGAAMAHFHVGAVAPGADAEEGDAVAVLRVHVGLDLEHEAGELRFGRFDHALDCLARLRRRGPVGQRA
jgi:hypothetical protein